MRTKTLLVACAALAFSLATLQAQVYSANVVGYINVTVPAGGFVPLGNTLINGNDANNTNNNINACFGPGLISDPNNATGDPINGSNSVVYIWTGFFSSAYYYFNATDATTWQGGDSPAGWYDRGYDYFNNLTVQQGQAAFLQNSPNSPASMTATLVGTVSQSTNKLQLVPGFNFISYTVPIGGTNPVDPNGVFGLPLTMTSTNLANVPSQQPDSTMNDTIYTWNSTGSGFWNSAYYYFNSADATYWQGGDSPAGFYDQGYDNMDPSLYPKLSLGFFLYHVGPSTITYTNTFTVQ